MSLDLNYYKKYFRQGVDYEEKKNENLSKELGQNYNKQYNTKINQFQILKNSNRANVIYKEGMPITCVVDYSVKWSKSNINPLWRKVLVDHNILTIGDLVQFENKTSKELEDYLFISRVENEDGYDELYMQKCNNILKFNYNGLNFTQKCIIEEIGRNNMTLEEYQSLQISDSSFLVTIPFNDNTKKLPLGCRLIFGMNVYEMIGLDDISSQGLIKLKLQLNEKRVGLDNFDTGYADNSGLATDSYSINILNGDFTAKVGEIVQLNIQLLNSGSVEPSTLDKFIFTSSDETIATVSTGGLISVINEGACQITCKLKDNETIQSYIDIIVVNDVILTNITYDLTPNASMGYEIKKSNTNTFTGHKYDNSTEIATTFDFDVNYNGLSTSAISIVEITATYIKIKNVSVDTTTPYKTIYILYKEQSQTEWLSKEIILKGIFG